jgi:hypothetical protein
MSNPKNSIDYVGTANAALMWKALTDDGSDAIIEKNNKPVITLDEKKKRIMVNINKLTRDQKLNLGNIINKNGPKDCIRECAEGSVVNLNILSPQLINDIYNFIEKIYN